MEKIELKEVLPAAFAAGGPAVLRSEIWRREVTFRRGEFCLVEAASGAGKSSLCSFLYGIRGDYAGRILFDGVDCRTLSRAAWGDVRRTSLSLLFQDLRLFGELTVAENIALKNDLTRFQTAERIDGCSRRPESPTSAIRPSDCFRSASGSAWPSSAPCASLSISCCSTSR